MRRSRFTEEQVVAILAKRERGEAHGGALSEARDRRTRALCQWKAEHGGMQDEPSSAIGPRTMASDAPPPQPRPPGVVCGRGR